MELTLNHIEPHDLKRLIRGELEETAAHQVLLHLETCEVCLQTADELWEQLPWGQAISPNQPDAQTAARLREKLSRQLSRSNLNGAVLRLGSKGFLGVVTAVLRPLLRFTAPTHKGDHRD